MTPTERFQEREESHHEMQTRIEAARDGRHPYRFHEPTDAEIDAELKRRKEEAMDNQICFCGVDEGTNLDCDRCAIIRSMERLSTIEQAIFGEVTTSEQVAAKIKLQIEATNQQRKLGS